MVAESICTPCGEGVDVDIAQPAHEAVLLKFQILITRSTSKHFIEMLSSQHVVQSLCLLGLHSIGHGVESLMVELTAKGAPT